MSFSPIKSWDDRRTCDPHGRINGRTWVRRIRWLEDAEGRTKLKMEDGATYREVIAVGGMAQTIWDRFKVGQPIDDCVSILANPVPACMASKRLADESRES